MILQIFCGYFLKPLNFTSDGDPASVKNAKGSYKKNGTYCINRFHELPEN
jgi:hypothetical protein